MRVKICSVRADEHFLANEGTRWLSANMKLEKEIQAFLDENPGVEIKHLQFSSVAIVPKTTSWDTTNSGIDWEIEKTVLILYETSA